MFRRHNVGSPVGAEESPRILVRFYRHAAIYYRYHVRLRDVVQHIASNWPVYTAQNEVAIKSSTVSDRMLYFYAHRIDNKASIGGVVPEHFCRNIYLSLSNRVWVA